MRVPAFLVKTLATFAVGGVVAAIALHYTGPASPPTTLELTGIDGNVHSPLATTDDTLQVFVITNHECPIANAYAPTLARLSTELAADNVALWIVQADPDIPAAAARKHADDYRLPRPVLLDPRHALIAKLGATMTPEAIVLRGRDVLYRGRIDDQWQRLGMRAQSVSSHDLRDAIAAALAGEAIATPRTPVIGCLLPEPRR